MKNPVWISILKVGTCISLCVLNQNGDQIRLFEAQDTCWIYLDCSSKLRCTGGCSSYQQVDTNSYNVDKKCQCCQAHGYQIVAQAYCNCKINSNLHFILIQFTWLLFSNLFKLKYVRVLQRQKCSVVIHFWRDLGRTFHSDWITYLIIPHICFRSQKNEWMWYELTFVLYTKKLQSFWFLCRYLCIQRM